MIVGEIGFKINNNMVVNALRRP